MSEKKEEQITRYETMDDAWEDFEASVLRHLKAPDSPEETLAFVRECFYAGAGAFRSIYYTFMAENSFPGVLKLNSMLDLELEKMIDNRLQKAAGRRRLSATAKESIN